jgi:Tol biopolymer transport system component
MQAAEVQKTGALAVRVAFGTLIRGSHARQAGSSRESLMALAAGMLLGPYEILAELGKGGMGTVYQARDRRLDRLLAIKVLKEPSPELRERFDLEARVIAGLQHPHICTLHDIGTQDGVDYLVMEYLDGHTLRCPQPLVKALEYGCQIADALDAAHRQGLTHRDVKPANVMITRSGAKLLDFGIAKRAPGRMVDGPAAPTTSAGTIVGTLNYMAPEQLEGEPVDARTDVWSFGTLLYEMLTGQRAFSGKSTAAVIAAVMESDPPDLDRIRNAAPPGLERLIRRCLAKDPEQRWQSMRDVELELESIQEACAEVPARGKSRWMYAAATGLLTLAAAVVVWLWKPAPHEIFEVNVTAPPNTVFADLQAGLGGSALSPDGTMLAFVARSQGKHRLWLRRLDRLEGRVLPEADGAYYPFWSPDSRWIGFFAGEQLKKIAVTGGVAQTLCQARSGKGGTWNRDGVILFAATSTERTIHRVPALGGSPSPVTKLTGDDDSHYWPRFLPGGQAFLYLNRSAQRGKSAIVAVRLDAPAERHWVAAAESNAVYGSGHVLYLRDRTLLALPFVERSLAVSGEPFGVAESVDSLPGSGLGSFSVSDNGLLLFSSGTGAQNRLIWRDRRGDVLSTFGAPGHYINPRLSPDGRQLAFAQLDARSWDIWLADVERGMFTRLTSASAFESNPTWSMDGTRLTFTGTRNIYQRAATGGGPSTRLTTSQLFQHPQDWSPDGRYLLFSEEGERTSRDIILFDAMTSQITPFLQTEFAERHPQFHPGNRWIAYVSAETGSAEVYLQQFIPGAGTSGARVRVSTHGGTMPRWRRDGQELYFLSPDGRIMMTTVILARGAARTSPPAALFSTAASPTLGVDWSYDVSRDGQRFLLIEPVENQEARSLTLFTNWLTRATRN